jgi:hypothetical protein
MGGFLKMAIQKGIPNFNRTGAVEIDSCGSQMPLTAGARATRPHRYRCRLNPDREHVVDFTPQMNETRNAWRKRF